MVVLTNILEDIKFVEAFLEKYLGLKKNSLKGKVKIKQKKDNEVIFSVDEQEITIKIKK